MDIKGLHVRVSRHVRDANGKDTRIIGCWPVSETARKSITDLNIAEMQFDGKPDVFTVGSELKGDIVITKLTGLKANVKDENGLATGELAPRFKLDDDGNTVSKDGKDVVLQRATIRFNGKVMLVRAKPTEELVETVEKIA